ncbi:MAG TPA: sigma factor, partial [Pseudonocardiaceae bacterium]|nr:sigma factor [Pseudonocardiaceae bacterium]
MLADQLLPVPLRVVESSAAPTVSPQLSSSVDVSDLATVVAAAVSGDRPAVERLLGLIRPLVVRYCRARVGRQERSFASADDVAQEVCLAVLTALSTYQDQGRPFLAFVYGIAAHKVADAHRAAARNRAEPVAEVPDAPELDAGPE